MARARLPRDDRRRTEAGFTMVEVLVVVFIIGLMSALVVMNLPAAKPAAVAQADALVRDLNRASREAIVSGEPMALAVRGGAYRFERYRAGFWSPAGGIGNPPAEARGAVDIEITPEGERRRPEPDEDTNSGEAIADFERKLVFSPVGDATPVSIRVSDGVNQLAITVTADGRVRRSDEQGDPPQ